MKIPEAAAYLNCSESTVRRYMKSNRLSVQYKKEPRSSGSPTAHLNDEEVRQLKQELTEPLYLSIPETTDLISERGGISEENLEDVIGAFSSWGYSQYLFGLKQKLLLTIPEAAEISNMSQDFIRKSIKEKKMPAIKPGRGWRIKLIDLQDFTNKLYLNNCLVESHHSGRQ